MNKFLLVLALAAAPALAQDRNFNGDYLSPHYQTGGYTNGQFKTTEFAPSPKPRYLPARPQSNLREAADAVMDYDSYYLGMILIDRGQVVYKRFKGGTDDATEFNSWSMSKSITNILVGQAMCQGDIRSLSDRAYQYLPDIRNTAYGQATIYQLLTMTSGAAPPDPYGGEMKGSNFELTRGFRSQRDFIHRDGQPLQPGVWAYDGLHHATLGLILDSLRGRKHYVQQFLNQAGVENKSHWLTDRDGHINAAYGFGLTIEDWARIAQLSMDMLNNKADIPNRACVSEFLKQGTENIVKPQDMTTLNYKSFYGWGYTWTHPTIKNGYAWQGAYGQKVWVDPNSQRIVIAFRHYKSKAASDDMGQLFRKWRQGYYD